MSTMQNDKIDNFKLILDRFKVLAKKVEDYDKFRRSKESIQNIANWLLALSAGTLLWFINSFDKFIFNKSLAFKQLYICTIILLGLSVVAFVLNRILLYMRQLGIDISIEVLETLPRKIELMDKDKDYEEFTRTFEAKIEKAIEVYAKAHNLITNWIFLIKLGTFLYLVGLIFLITYIVLFLSKL